jgi:Flp pilus assembly protein TadG
MTVLKRSANRAGERGQALAEFALVLPLLLLLIAGIIEFGRAWNIKQAVTDAAREGARYAVVADGAMTLAVVEDKIKERLALASIDTAAATIGISGDFHSAGEMTVNVSAEYRMAFVGALMHWLGGTPDITIDTEVTMRSEY